MEIKQHPNINPSHNTGPINPFFSFWHKLSNRSSQLSYNDASLFKQSIYSFLQSLNDSFTALINPIALSTIYNLIIGLELANDFNDSLPFSSVPFEYKITSSICLDVDKVVWILVIVSSTLL